MLDRFAVQTLTRWYEADKDPRRKMPLPSTYLGHVCVAGTYCYLNANPELMANAMARLERRWGESSCVVRPSREVLHIVRSGSLHCLVNVTRQSQASVVRGTDLITARPFDGTLRPYQAAWVTAA